MVGLKPTTIKIDQFNPFRASGTVTNRAIANPKNDSERYLAEDSESLKVFELRLLLRGPRPELRPNFTNLSYIADCNFNFEMLSWTNR